MESDDDYEVEAPVGDDPMIAMMPMSFGKQGKKKDLNALSAGFAKTKRVVFHVKRLVTLQIETKQPKVEQPKVVAQAVDDSSDDDMIGPMPAAAEDPEDEID